jgi:hypothetical protein
MEGISVSQEVVDQAVCWAIFSARAHGGFETGDVVRDLVIPHGAVGRPDPFDTHVSEAAVEQRHLDAVSLLLKNFGTGVVVWGVRFRIEPCDSASG